MILPTWAVRAGARKTILYEPSRVQAAIVTCGGLCPGLNDVVQGLVKKLSDYGVPDGNIKGIRYAPPLFRLSLLMKKFLSQAFQMATSRAVGTPPCQPCLPFTSL